MYSLNELWKVLWEHRSLYGHSGWKVEEISPIQVRTRKTSVTDRAEFPMGVPCNIGIVAADGYMSRSVEGWIA